MRAHLADSVLLELVVHTIELLDAVHLLLKILLQVHSMVREALTEKLVLRQEVMVEREASLNHLLATLQERLIGLVELLLLLDTLELFIVKVQLCDQFKDLGCIATSLIQHPGTVNDEMCLVMTRVSFVSIFAEDSAVIDVRHLARQHPDSVLAVAIDIGKSRSAVPVLCARLHDGLQIRHLVF